MFDGGRSEKRGQGRVVSVDALPKMARGKGREKQLNGEGFKHKRYLNTVMFRGRRQ